MPQHSGSPAYRGGLSFLSKAREASAVKRRSFITLLGGAAVAWPLATRAQQAASLRKVGFLSDESASLGRAAFEAVARTLRELGYVEGRSIGFEARYADGKDDALASLAAEVVRA